MLEQVGDIFKQKDADAICFTSNGVVKQNSELVMGAGVALAFKNKWPNLPKFFGKKVEKNGNHVYAQAISLHAPTLFICSFPTKNNWQDPSDLKLIEQSANELVQVAKANGWKRVYLTRPGCGLGGLDWDTQVKPLISPILDNRFVILTPEKK
jgi:O-acetyl-ADP-ribose deacetylase (regulator of RNase III)